MSTVVIVILIAVVVLVVGAALYMGSGQGGGRGLKRRFGPEYDRTVARHDGDTKAAERELDERVKRHGSLKLLPLPSEAREQYTALWAGLQEQFVDAPQKAVAEAEVLLSRLAKDRGFPDGGKEYEEQVAAISVHHSGTVQGYRRVHVAAHGEGSTEDMRKAMIEARALFEELVSAQPSGDGRNRQQQITTGDEARSDGHTRAPWALGRRHEKGSGAR